MVLCNAGSEKKNYIRERVHNRSHPLSQLEYAEWCVGSTLWFSIVSLWVNTQGLFWGPKAQQECCIYNLTVNLVRRDPIILSLLFKTCLIMAY